MYVIDLVVDDKIIIEELRAAITAIHNVGYDESIQYGIDGLEVVTLFIDAVGATQAVHAIRNIFESVFNRHKHNKVEISSKGIKICGYGPEVTKDILKQIFYLSEQDNGDVH